MSNSGESALAFNEGLLYDFQSALLQAGNTVHALGDLTDVISHDGKAAGFDIDIATGVHVVNSMLRCAESTWSFDIRRGSRLGREDSRNSAFFGSLSCDAAVCGAEVGVAVKPVETTSALIGETAMHQYLYQLGLPTLKPIGLVVGGDHRYLLTAFEESVETIDTLEWRDKEFEEKCAQLGCVIDTFVMLHAKMLFHGDTFFRNMATDEAGDPVIVDPEFMISAKHLAEAALDGDECVYEKNVECIKRLMSAEFTNVCHSIDRYVYDGNPPKNDPTRLKSYKRLIFGPYRYRIEETNSPYKNILLDAYARMMHERRVRARDGSL